MQALDVYRRELPEVRILVLAANENPDNLRAAIAVGAAGYLTKQTRADELCEAVLTVHRGGSAVARSLAAQLSPAECGEAGDSHPTRSALSARQRAIVRLVSKGLTDVEIAFGPHGPQPSHWGEAEDRLAKPFGTGQLGHQACVRLSCSSLP